MVLVWLSVRSEVQMIFIYDPADTTATPSSLASLKSKMVLPFWYQLSQVVLEKRPLNECSIHAEWRISNMIVAIWWRWSSNVIFVACTSWLVYRTNTSWVLLIACHVAVLCQIWWSAFCWSWSWNAACQMSCALELQVGQKFLDVFWFMF